MLWSIRFYVITALGFGIRGTKGGNILLQQFNNTAHAGKPSVVSTVDGISPDLLRPYTSARFFCSVDYIPAPGVKFAVAGNAGHVRVFVDHHLLVSADLSSADHADTTGILSDHVIHSCFNRSLVQIDVTLHEIMPSYLTVRTHLDDDDDDNATDAIQCLPIERELDNELYYHEERARHEIGWGNWLSEDITSQVLLPHGLAVSLYGDHHFSGPTCNEDQYPLRHGIRAVDGHYSEIEYVKDSTGHAFRLQSANADTTMVIQVDDYYEKISPSGQLSIDFAIPSAYIPRYCSFGTSSIDCPGLESIEWIILNAAADAASMPSGSNSSLSIDIVKLAGEPVFIVLYASTRKDDQTAGIPLTPSEAQAFVAAHRKQAINDLLGNEILAGVTAAISWNKIYSPLEGIFTPVFRGRIWSVSVPYAYVLFEWDTYLGSFIATNLGDEWVAASNIIRMTLTFWHQGFVPGFWNGKCGEVDKSKPPLGAWALLMHVEKYPDHLWIARFLIRYLEAWNDWWVQQRMVDSLIAPGSVRSNVGLSWHCEAHGPVYSAVCETGLDNSPIYDSASFIPSAGLLDYWDVGLSAIFVLDCQSIAELAKLLGLASLDEKMSLRAATTSLAINENLWNDEMGIYLNKKWTDKTWVDIDAKSGARPVAPTSFYPMLAKIPSPGQTVRMVQGYLVNPSEFGVCAEFDYGIPSIARSSSASQDNRYWRGRTWGPMNFLVYVGLEQYDHLPEVSQAMTDLARQSKNTFLKEWVSHRRIMENYSSNSGDGCDVRDANPFYHWGALLGLISEMEASRVAMDTETSVGPELTLAMAA